MLLLISRTWTQPHSNCFQGCVPDRCRVLYRRSITSGPMKRGLRSMPGFHGSRFTVHGSRFTCSPRGTHQAGERKLPDEQFRRPLVPPDLLQRQRARAVPTFARGSSLAPFRPPCPTCQEHARVGFRFQVPGFKIQVPGSRFQVSGFRFEVSGPWSTEWKCGDWSGGNEVVTKSADGQNTHT